MAISSDSRSFTKWNGDRLCNTCRAFHTSLYEVEASSQFFFECNVVFLCNCHWPGLRFWQQLHYFMNCFHLNCTALFQFFEPLFDTCHNYEACFIQYLSSHLYSRASGLFWLLNCNTLVPIPPTKVFWLMGRSFHTVHSKPAPFGQSTELLEQKSSNNFSLFIGYPWNCVTMVPMASFMQVLSTS